MPMNLPTPGKNPAGGHAPSYLLVDVTVFNRRLSYLVARVLCTTALYMHYNNFSFLIVCYVHVRLEFC